jgi:hypothetical protein
MIALVFAAPRTTPAAANNAVAVKAQGNGEVQVASAVEKTTVETTQQ